MAGIVAPILSNLAYDQIKKHTGLKNGGAATRNIRPPSKKGRKLNHRYTPHILKRGGAVRRKRGGRVKR